MKKLLLVLSLLLSLTLTACDEPNEPKKLETVEDVKVVRVDVVSLVTTEITVKNPNGEVSEYKLRDSGVELVVGKTYDIYVEGAFIRASEESK